jgi:hypothetical protein
MCKSKDGISMRRQTVELVARIGFESMASGVPLKPVSSWALAPEGIYSMAAE